MMGHSVYLQQVCDDTNLGGVADTLEGCAAIQRCLNRLEKRAHRKLVKFIKGMCKVPYLGRNSPVHWYVLRAVWLDRSLAEKDLGVLEDTRLNQCALAA